MICISAMAASAQKETSMMTNPVIFADVPDLDIIRVDDTYYRETYMIL